MRTLLSSLLLFIYIGTLSAQIRDSIAHDLSEIEISREYKPSTSQSTSPLQVITESDALKQGIQSVTDAVKRFNGVVLKDYGGIGGLKTISIRGMGAEYTTISYDGVVVNNLQSGQVDIGRFTLDNLSMLSLSIGQGDNIFQPAKSQSTTGVLNLQTKKPQFANKRYNLHTKITTGSFGLFEPMLDFSYKISNKSSINANINWQRADGRYSFEEKKDLLFTKQKRKNSDTDILRSEINIYNQLGKKDQLDIKLYYFDSERGLPGSTTLYANQSKDRLWDKNAFAQFMYNRRFSDSWKLKSLLKYDYNYQKYKTIAFTGDQLSKYYQHEVYWSNSVLWSITPKLSASLAQDLGYNSLRDEIASFSDARSEPNRYSSYTALSSQYKTDVLTITANGLYTYVHEKIVNKENKKQTFKKLSPAISASIKPFTSTNLRFRASYKHIYRIPTFTELYYVSTGKNLKPESSSQFNIGSTWVGNITNSPVEYINISVDAYYNDVKDKIVITPTPFLPMVDNQGKVKMKGVDAKIATNIKIIKDIDIDISGVYSYMHAYDDDKKNRNTYKGQLPYTPKHSGSTTITINNPWVGISYTVLASGIRYTKAENIEDNKVKSYTEHSINAFKELNIRNYKVYANANLSNFLNKNYNVIAFYPMPGRSFKISIGCKF